MKTVEAIVLLQRLEVTKQQHVALSPEDYAGTGLHVHKKLVTQDKEPIFYYVDRLEFIELLKREHKLIARNHAIHRNR